MRFEIGWVYSSKIGWFLHLILVGYNKNEPIFIKNGKCSKTFLWKYNEFFGTYIYQVVRDGRECRFMITLILYTVYGFLSNE